MENKKGEKIENKKKEKMIVPIIIAVIIIALVAIIIFLVLKLNDNNQTNMNNSTLDSNIQETNTNLNLEENTDTTSFSNLKADDEKFNATQSTIIDYFDNNYFSYVAISNFQRYPQIFKGSKIETNVIILKVLKSTDNEFEVLAVQGGTMAYDYSTGETSVYTGYDVENMAVSDWPENNLIVVEGKQLNKRLTKGDVITLYGRFNNVDNFSIDGTDYILPVANAINIVQLTSNDMYRFNADKIKTVAEYIFGKDIKMSTPVLGEDYDSEANYEFDPFYKITLDNQSNLNFSAFNMYRTYGLITYNNVSKNTIKKLFITPDFQHYIVTTYDIELKHVYIDYFDKEFKKIWNREFDVNSSNPNVQGPLDYNSSQLAIVIDNDLYLINLENGENIIEPIIVGEKINLNMTSDSIILIGNDNKDAIMKVGLDGKIIYRTNGNIDFESIEASQIQIIDNKVVVRLYGAGNEGFPYEKYIVLNEDGTIETETESMEAMN